MKIFSSVSSEQDLNIFEEEQIKKKTSNCSFLRLNVNQCEGLFTSIRYSFYMFNCIVAGVSTARIIRPHAYIHHSLAFTQNNKRKELRLSESLAITLAY